MSVQKREKIACFGAPGSYSHEALYCHFGKSADIVFYAHFEDLVNRIEAGECRYGVLPVENSSTGGIAEVYDLILRHNCHIVGEEYVHVQHLLLGAPGARLEDYAMSILIPRDWHNAMPFYDFTIRGNCTPTSVRHKVPRK